MRRRYDRQESVKELSQPTIAMGFRSTPEKRISQRAFTAEKKKKEKKNGPRIVKAALKSIYCGSFN